MIEMLVLAGCLFALGLTFAWGGWFCLAEAKREERQWQERIDTLGDLNAVSR